MNDLQLFLGFPLNAALSAVFDHIDPKRKSLFVNEGESYLQEVSVNGTRYLGKPIGRHTDLPQLELLQANIYSLLKKILPEDHPFESIPLVLLTVTSASYAA